MDCSSHSSIARLELLIDCKQRDPTTGQLCGATPRRGRGRETAQPPRCAGPRWRFVGCLKAVLRPWHGECPFQPSGRAPHIATLAGGYKRRGIRQPTDCVVRQPTDSSAAFPRARKMWKLPPLSLGAHTGAFRRSAAFQDSPSKMLPTSTRRPPAGRSPSVGVGPKASGRRAKSTRSTLPAFDVRAAPRVPLS
jgi:hypothetical protein